VGHAVQDTLLVVSFKTYKHWLLDQRLGRQPRKGGRPRIAQDLVQLIVRIGKENLAWGIRRIVGELKKLGRRVGPSTIKRVLKREGVFPGPHHRSWGALDSPWRHFLALHMNTIVACDFLCKEILTPMGRKTAHLLMFMHLGTRKVFLSPATY